MSELYNLVDLLCSKVLVNRTGLLLVPHSYLGKEADLVAGLNLDSIDICDFYSKRIPEGSKFISLSVGKLIITIEDITNISGLSDAVLVYNLDLLLSKLTQLERHQTWDRLFHAFPHKKRGVLFFMLSKSENLIPDANNLQAWFSNSRAVKIQ